MRIVVPLLRQSFLKSLGSVIDEGVRRGHEIIVLWDSTLGSKVSEAFSTEQISEIWPSVRVLDVVLGDPGSVDVSSWEALVGVELMEPQQMAPIVDRAVDCGVPVFSVSDLYESAVRDPALMGRLACTFYVSQHQYELHRALRSGSFVRLEQDGVLPRVAFVGCTCNDQLRLVQGEEVRRRLVIPADRPVVLFMTLKMGVPEPFRRFAWGEGSRLSRTLRAVARGEMGVVGGVWRAPHYREIVQAVRDFCDREGAFLIGKSRLKNADPEWMRGYFDLYVDRDEVRYPYPVMEFLAISSLCVHFESGTVLEAAQAGVRSLSIVVPQDHLMNVMGGHLDLARSRIPGSMFNSPGIVDSIPYGEFCDHLKSATLDGLRPDPGARDAYVQSYLHSDDLRSAARILDAVEASAP